MPKPTYVVLAVKNDESYDSGQIHHVEYAGLSRKQALHSMEHAVVTEQVFVMEERVNTDRGNKVDNAILFHVVTPYPPVRFQKFLIKNGEVL